MKKTIFFSILSLLILIHTIDMILTERYVGDNWELETFLPMQICIKEVGIHNALWISRIIMYSYFWICIDFWENKPIQSSLLVVSILYWTAMLPWLYTLKLISWP